VGLHKKHGVKMQSGLKIMSADSYPVRHINDVAVLHEVTLSIVRKVRMCFQTDRHLFKHS